MPSATRSGELAGEPAEDPGPPPAIPARSLRRSAWPLVDVGLAALAAAVWYVRPDAGAWPLLLIALGWLARWWGSGRLTQPTPFDVPLLLFLASALAAAAIGFNQGTQWMDGPAPLLAAWAKYWYVVAGIGLFFAIANLRRVEHVWRFAQSYTLLAAVVAVYFVVTNDWTATGAKFDFLSQLGAAIARPFGGLPGRRLHPNVAGGIIAMVMPFLVPLWLAARGRRWSRLLWSALALVAPFGLLLSESRGAWLALAIAGGLWIVAHELVAWRTGMRGRGRMASLLLMMLLGVGALAVVVALAGQSDLGAVSGPAVNPVPGAGLPGTSTVISRLGLLQAGWTLGQDYLFTGAGLGTTPWVLSTYYLLVPVYITAHTHNMFLDVLVEQGLPGFVPFVFVLMLAVGLALRALRMPGMIAAPESRIRQHEAAADDRETSLAQLDARGVRHDGEDSSPAELDARSVRHDGEDEAPLFDGEQDAFPPDETGQGQRAGHGSEERVRHFAGEQDATGVLLPIRDPLRRPRLGVVPRSPGAGRFSRRGQDIRPSSAKDDASHVQHPVGDPPTCPAVLAGMHSSGGGRVGRGREDMRPSPGERTRWLLQAALVSLCVMALHGLVDDVGYGSRALVLLFVPAALIVATCSACPGTSDAPEAGSLPPVGAATDVPGRTAPTGGREPASEVQPFGVQPKRPLGVPRWLPRTVLLGIALLALLAAWQRSSVSAMVFANLGAVEQTQIELGPYRLPDRLPEQMRRSANLSSAISRFERALSLDAGNREANQRLGEIALARGQYEQARDYLEAASRRDPASTVNWQLLGDAYLALGRMDEAYALWSRVNDAPTQLELEAVIRFEPIGDFTRARQARDLAARIRTTRSPTVHPNIQH